VLSVLIVSDIRTIVSEIPARDEEADERDYSTFDDDDHDLVRNDN
jgi:hypothetical protein